MSHSLQVVLGVFILTRIVVLIVAYAGIVLMTPSVKTYAPGDPSRSQIFYERLTGWDGNWYIAAATRGYGEAGENPGTGESTRPFFPLLPALIKVGNSLGFDPRLVGLAVTNLSFLIALFFCHRLFELELDSRLATTACWIAGAGPFSIVFSMVYAEALTLVGTAAAFYFYARKRPWLAGASGAVAALARPNGVAAALVLGAAATSAVLSSKHRWREALRWSPVALLPGAALLGWAGLMWKWTRDPIAFITSKRAWTEVTTGGLLTDHANKVSSGTSLHILLGIAALAIVIYTWIDTPWTWKALWFAYVFPAFMFGLSGVGRYAWTIFPTFTGTGLVFLQRRVSIPMAYAMAMLATLVTVGIFEGRLVP